MPEKAWDVRSKYILHDALARLHVAPPSHRLLFLSIRAFAFVSFDILSEFLWFSFVVIHRHYPPVSYGLDFASQLSAHEIGDTTRSILLFLCFHFAFFQHYLFHHPVSDSPFLRFPLPIYSHTTKHGNLTSYLEDVDRHKHDTLSYEKAATILISFDKPWLPDSQIRHSVFAKLQRGRIWTSMAWTVATRKSSLFHCGSVSDSINKCVSFRQDVLDLDGLQYHLDAQLAAKLIRGLPFRDYERFIEYWEYY